jgi:hypothetical protein
MSSLLFRLFVVQRRAMNQYRARAMEVDMRQKEAKKAAERKVEAS